MTGVRILRGAGRAYLWAASGLILIGYVGILIHRGWFALIEIVAPHNYINLVAVVATVLPGAVLIKLADRVEARTGQSSRKAAIRTKAGESARSPRATARRHDSPSHYVSSAGDEPVDTQSEDAKQWIQPLQAVARRAGLPVPPLHPGCEEIPNGDGAFGRSPNNPIPVNGLIGEVCYLERLRNCDGSPVFYHRLGTCKPAAGGTIIDVYELAPLDGSARDQLYFDMYYDRRSTNTPAGYGLARWGDLSDVERIIVKVGVLGTNERVDPFPAGLPEKVAANLRAARLPLRTVDRAVSTLRRRVQKFGNASRGSDTTRPVAPQPGPGPAESGDSVASPVMAGGDVGVAVVEKVREYLSVDAEWVVERERGFEWWAGPLRQMVWADDVVVVDDLLTSRVHVVTDLISDASSAPPQALLGSLGRAATLYGLVGGAGHGEYKLHSSVNVHEASVESLSRLLAGAAGMQIGECAVFAEPLARALKAQFAISEHPTNGPRYESDEMMGVVDTLVATRGQAPLEVTRDDFEQIVDMFRSSGAPAEMLDQGLGFRVKVPATGDVLEVLGNDHPKHGCGVLFVLLTQRPGNDVPVLLLNSLEHEAELPLHGIGSWCNNGAAAAHAAFLPNAYCNKQFVGDLAGTALIRSLWMSELRESALADRSEATRSEGPHWARA